jgi:hypothetical protein
MQSAAVSSMTTTSIPSLQTPLSAQCGFGLPGVMTCALLPDAPSTAPISDQVDLTVKDIVSTYDIITSHDLSNFLCNVASVQCGSAHSATRSCYILLSYYSTSSNININADMSTAAGDPFVKWNNNYRIEKVFTIANIAGNKITLTEPYIGPPVVDGYPCIKLRTNLIITGNNDSKVTTDIKSLATQLIKVVGCERLENADVSINSSDNIVLLSVNGSASAGSVSTMTAHPYLPIVCIGYTQGYVNFLLPDDALSHAASDNVYALNRRAQIEKSLGLKI